MLLLNHIKKSCQRGYTLMEMAIVLVIVGIIVAASAGYYQNLAKDNFAQAVADELIMANGGLAAYGNKHFTELQQDVLIPGFADNLNPTLAELSTAGFLPQNFMAVGHNLLGSNYKFTITPLSTVNRSSIFNTRQSNGEFAYNGIHVVGPTYTPKDYDFAYLVYADQSYDDMSLLDKVINIIGKNAGITSIPLGTGVLQGKDASWTWQNPTLLPNTLAMLTGWGMDMPQHLVREGDRRDLNLVSLIAQSGVSDFENTTQTGQFLNAGQIISTGNVAATSFWNLAKANSTLCGAVGQMTTDVYGNLVNCKAQALNPIWVPDAYGNATQAAAGTVLTSSWSQFIQGDLLLRNNLTNSTPCIATSVTITTSRDIVLPPGCQNVEVYLWGSGGGGATPYQDAAGNYWSATIPAYPGDLVGTYPYAWNSASYSNNAAFQNSPGKLFHVNIASNPTPPGTNGQPSFITDNANNVVMYASGGAAGGVQNSGTTPLAGATGVNTTTVNATFATNLSGLGGIASPLQTDPLATGQTVHTSPFNIATQTANDRWNAGFAGPGGNGGWTNVTNVPNAPLAGSGYASNIIAPQMGLGLYYGLDQNGTWWGYGDLGYGLGNVWGTYAYGDPYGFGYSYPFWTLLGTGTVAPPTLLFCNSLIDNSPVTNQPSCPAIVANPQPIPGITYQSINFSPAYSSVSTQGTPWLIGYNVATNSWHGWDNNGGCIYGNPVGGGGLPTGGWFCPGGTAQWQVFPNGSGAMAMDYCYNGSQGGAVMTVPQMWVGNAGVVWCKALTPPMPPAIPKSGGGGNPGALIMVFH